MSIESWGDPSTTMNDRIGAVTASPWISFFLTVLISVLLDDHWMGVSSFQPSILPLPQSPQRQQSDHRHAFLGIISHAPQLSQYQHQQKSTSNNHQRQHRRDRSFRFALSASSSAANDRPSTMAAAAASDPSRSSQSQSASPRVLYQKVLRPPPLRDNSSQNQRMDGLAFLGALIDYLQDTFQLPDRLAMPYDKQLQQLDSDGTSSDDSSSSSSSYPVVSWDSSLSPCSRETRLNVQVVGIFTEPEEEQNDQTSTTTPTKASSRSSTSRIPSMAMVVVTKEPSSPRTPTPTLPPLLQNLFRDSEAQIIKALDRGLQDFAAGKIRLRQEKHGSPDQQQPDLNEAFLAELLDGEEEDDDNDEQEYGDIPGQQKANQASLKHETNKKNAMLAELVTENFDAPTHPTKSDPSLSTNPLDPSLSTRQQAALKSMTTVTPAAPKSTTISTDQNEASPPPKGLDYAVQAAKQAAQRRKEAGALDFAVQAAAKVVKQKANAATTVSRPPRSNTPNDMVEASQANPPVTLDMKSIRPPGLDTNNAKASGRTFMKSISTPQDFIQRQRQKRTKKTSTDDANSIPSSSLSPSGRSHHYVTATDETMATAQKGAHDGDQRNASPVLSMPPEANISFASEQASVHHDADASLELERLDAMKNALDEIEAQGKNLTPQELLENVMTFGEQQEKENVVGQGFVSGAFEMAKDLLREQRDQREQRLRESVTTKQVATETIGVQDNTDLSATRVKELSEEEELRQMFEAGERIAEGRITSSSSHSAVQGASSMQGSAAKEEIDSLISSDKAISSYARILDEELAELEIRINRSPGEEYDSPRKHPIFDILSGPEVYNPNVDAETAVNWPGARPGTKSVRLSKQLKEAVEQAEFASRVLSNLKESSELNANGESVTRYFAGDKEVSPEQVHNLRTVFREAVDLGLISDPVTVMAERSRLQMLIDELWTQPEERVREIAMNYIDLLLSDNFVSLVKERLAKMAERDIEALRNDDSSLKENQEKERAVLGQLVVYAQLLLKEAQAFGSELEAQQLELIRSICKVAMDPSHRTEEETAMALTDAVRDMRPLFDDAFVAYLKYAVAEEQGRLARAGLLDDPAHSKWLSVLKIVQQGVYSELAKGISRYIDHIWYVLRMETPTERRMLLKKLIDVMPTLDVRPFVQVVESIAGALGDSVKGDFDGADDLGDMADKVLQLRRDVKELLPPERIALMSRDADEWARKQKERLMEQRKLTQQRLKAARETEHMDGEIESLSRRGEFDRFD